jgi:hypothetical protein
MSALGKGGSHGTSRQMSVCPSGANLAEIALTRRQSDEFDDPDLRFRVGLDVTLRRPKVRVPSQHLDIPARTADRGYLPGDIGDESASAAVASTRNHWSAKRALSRFWCTSDLVQTNGLASAL